MTSDNPAKKAAKKAPRKRATKAEQAARSAAAETVKKTRARKVTAKVESKPNIGSDTTTPPLSSAARGVVDAVGSRLDELIGEARGFGVPALLGQCTVSLHFDIDDATTPLDAVVEVTNLIMRNGLSSYTWLVRDEVTNEVYGVQDGRIINLEEARIAPE